MPNFTNLPERHFVDKAKRLSLGDKDADVYFDGEALEALINTVEDLQKPITAERIADGAIDLSKLSGDVTSKMPTIAEYTRQSNFKYLVYTADKPDSNGFFQLNQTGFNPTQDQEILKTMRPAYAIFRWNIAWFSGFSPYYQNTLLFQEVSRVTRPQYSGTIWEVTFQAYSEGYEYTLKEVFDHETEWGLFIPGYISCRRQKIVDSSSLLNKLVLYAWGDASTTLYKNSSCTNVFDNSGFESMEAVYNYLNTFDQIIIYDRPELPSKEKAMVTAIYYDAVGDTVKLEVTNEGAQKMYSVTKIEGT